MKTETNKNEPPWLEMTIDYPLFKATYNKIEGTDLYVVDITQLSPRKPGMRNMDFEVVYPLYHGLNDIIEQ